MSHRIGAAFARSVSVLLVTSLLVALTPASALGGPVACDPGDLVRAKAAGMASHSAGISPLVADDNIAQAVPLTAPVAGMLDAATDAHDVYSIALAEGSRLNLVLSGDAALNADVYVFSPGATDVNVSVPVAGTLGDALPKAVFYDVAPATGGTYYVAVCAASGAGAYSLACDTVATPSGPDDDAPGVSASSPVSDSLHALTDSADVYAITLAAGQRLSATLAGPDGAQFDLRLFAPGTSSVYGAVPAWGAATPGSAETMLFDAGAGQGGTYLLDVHAAEGAGAYTLTWTVSATPAGTWETAAAAVTLAHAGGTLAQSLDRATDANDFYKIDLAAGERLTVDLSGQDGTDFDAYAYGPSGGQPLVWANDTVYPERVTLDAAQAGTYYVEVQAFSGAGGYSLTWSVGAAPAWVPTSRTAGKNRYATAVAMSAATYPAGSVRTVVLATGASFADALAANGLAGCYDAPLLLTQTAQIPIPVLAEIDRLGATNVVIVGGGAAVSSGVASALRTIGYTVTRIQGVNRYDTAAKVASEIARLEGPDFVRAAFVARGDQFADALAVSPLAFRQRMPVLLTYPGSLAPETRTAIAQLGIEDVYIAGGTAAVTDAVKGAIDAVPGTTRPVVRLAGGNRYATAVAIAEYGIDRYWVTPGFVGFATGTDFPDALGGGAVCGTRGGVLLMTASTALSDAPAAFLRSHKGGVVATQVFGGDTAISPTVKAQIDAILR